MITSDIGEQEFQIRIGSKVVTADGHALGKVSALRRIGLPWRRA